MWPCLVVTTTCLSPMFIILLLQTLHSIYIQHICNTSKGYCFLTPFLYKHCSFCQECPSLTVWLQSSYKSFHTLVKFVLHHALTVLSTFQQRIAPIFVFSCKNQNICLTMLDLQTKNLKGWKPNQYQAMKNEWRNRARQGVWRKNSWLSGLNFTSTYCLWHAPHSSQCPFPTLPIPSPRFLGDFM